jgi:hypothetical protein
MRDWGALRLGVVMYRDRMKGRKQAVKDEQQKMSNSNSQLFQRRLDVWKFKEDSLVRDLLIVKHEADAPDGGREADILDTCQVVQYNLGVGLRSHFVLSCDQWLQ